MKELKKERQKDALSVQQKTISEVDLDIHSLEKTLKENWYCNNVEHTYTHTHTYTNANIYVCVCVCVCVCVTLMLILWYVTLIYL